tara:strand:- start:372 stop:584 length:213 start_codon:yes stop_codon:yes gene_type:complete
MVKPTQDEKMIIAILLSVTFGLMIGIWSMQEKINEKQAENDLLVYHIEELLNTHSIVNRVDIVTQPSDEN